MLSGGKQQANIYAPTRAEVKHQMGNNPVRPTPTANSRSEAQTKGRIFRLGTAQKFFESVVAYKLVHL